MLRNMGQICGMLLKTYVQESDMYEDIRAFGAPSECATDVRNGFIRDRIAMVEDFEKSTGYTAQELVEELEQRVSSKWLWQAGICEVFGAIQERREQAEFDRRRLKWFNQSKLPGVRRQYW